MPNVTQIPPSLLSVCLTTLSVIVGATAFWQFIIFIINRVDKKKELSLIKGMESLHRVYMSLTVMQDLGADRVVLFAGHNSGGIPRANSPFYISALHWVIKKEYRERFPDYNQTPVDSQFIGMLLQMERESYVRISADNLPDCLMKEMLNGEGITDSIKIYLGVVENKFMYVSASKYGGKFSDLEITRIRIRAATIATELRVTKGL